MRCVRRPLLRASCIHRRSYLYASVGRRCRRCIWFWLRRDLGALAPSTREVIHGWTPVEGGSVSRLQEGSRGFKAGRRKFTEEPLREVREERERQKTTWRTAPVPCFTFYCLRASFPLSLILRKRHSWDFFSRLIFFCPA